ncbi:SpoIIE family protein phosphatase [Streptomyces sp. NPDC047043]|uniref:SpoIIE family protein phosphatase n=1 Tax=Streptomyces sp. NPDC047043 TaxID=3154497 RepID=UPI0033FD614D
MTAAEVHRQQAARRLVDHVVLDAVEQTGAHAGGLWLLPPGEAVLTLENIVGVPPEFAAPWHRVALTHALPVTDAVAARAVVEVDSQQEMARRYPRAALVLPYNFALAAAPVVHEDTVLGALLLMWPGSRQRPLSPPVRDRLEAECSLLATVLHCAHSGSGAFGPSDQPRALDTAPGKASPGDGAAAAFSRRLPEGCVSLDLHGRIVHLNPAAADLLGSDASALMETLPWESVRWLDDPVYEDRYRTAVISRQNTLFTARHPDGRWLDFHLHPDDTGISVLITGAQRGHDVPAPSASAPAAATTRLGSLYHLMHLAGALTEAVSVNDVVALVADTVLPAFGAQALVILAAEGGRLRIVGHHGYPPETMRRFDGTPLTSATPGVAALTEATAGFFSDRAELEATYPARVGRDDGMAAWAFLPLTASGRPVGTCVLAYDRPHVFPAEERAAMTSLSGLIAQALDRARLYDTEHALAQSLQQGLLPHALPTVPGLDVAARYLPATHGMDIGGDFYDLIRLDEHTVAAVIGDVQGHNVTAAALMGQVRTAIHAHATAGAAPHEVLARTNRLLTDLNTDLFTSCLYARIDLETHLACLANAGHLPPVLTAPDGSATTLDLDAGLLLGITKEAAYSSREVPLPPRSLLALYTDGLVERIGTDLSTGIQALVHTLGTHHERPAEDAARHITQELGADKDRTDDVALILLRPDSLRAQAPLAENT